MTTTTRRWLTYAAAGVISSALGATINIATNMMSSVLAWALVGVLTIAGIMVAAGVDRGLRTPTAEPEMPAPAGASPGSAQAGSGNAYVFNFHGGKNRVNVKSHSGATLAMAGVVVFAATLGGMWVGSNAGADRSGGITEPSTTSSSAPAEDASSPPPAADRSGESCTVVDAPQETARLPFTCAVVQRDHTCGQDTWITTKSPTEIGESMPLAAKSGGWRKWPAVADGVAGSGGRYQLTIQGKDTAAVVLTGVTVHVLERRPPVNGYALGRACGGDGVFRTLDVDLDQSPPSLTPTFEPGHANSGTPEFEVKPIRFPYQVALDDPENFLVAGLTTTCDCDWAIDLNWTSQGNAGTVRITDNGTPFRTSSSANSKHCTVLEYITCK